MQMLKLDSTVTDTVTGQKGVLDQFMIHFGGGEFYLFQPGGMDKKTGKTLKRFWVAAARIKGGDWAESPSLPVEVLGTEVTDKATGFRGIAINLGLHVNGCVHLEVQPPATDNHSEAPESENFDIRSLKGKAVEKFTEKQLTESRREKPSPGHHVPFGSRA